MRHQTAFTWIELLVVLAIIAVLIALLWPAVQAAKVGDVLLRQKPDETNRVFSENGMSIIRPSGWISSPMNKANKLVFFSSPGRYTNSISVTSEKTDEEGKIPVPFQGIIHPESFKPIEFQGKPAFESVEQVRRSGGWEDPSYVVGEIYFFRDENIYLIRYRFLNEKMEAPENLRLFLDSFRAAESSGDTTLQPEK